MAWGILIGTVFLSRGGGLVQEQSDSQILAMGHRAWIGRHSKDQRGGAEERYAFAIGTQVNKLIKERSDSPELEKLSILLANITKGSARLGDYLVVPTGNGRLFMMKASTLASEAMINIMARRSSATPSSQSDVWRTFKEIQLFHQGNRTKIEAYARSGSGYSVDQFIGELNGIGTVVESTMKAISGRTPEEKSNVFLVCQRMLELTTGKDPAPY
jgi:hypothetical protein